MKKSKITAFLAALIMILPTFAGCATGNGGDVTTTEKPVVTDPNQALYDALPSTQYDDYQFNVLNITSNFAITTFDAEADGGVIEEAIYARNLATEKRLGVTINVTELSYKDAMNATKTQVDSKETFYDIVYNESWAMMSLAQGGYLYEAANLDITNDAPWWNENANDSLRVAGNLFMLVGDLHPMFWESMWAIAFNKTILNEMTGIGDNLKNPYELVRNKKWTLDNLITLTNEAYVDKDGSNDVSSEDRFGVATYKKGTANPILRGCGVYILQLDASGNPIFSDTSKLVDLSAKISDQFYTNPNVFNKGVSKEIASSFQEVFVNNQALFEMEVIGGIKDLRTTDVEYGILPYPMYDEQQGNYSTLIANYAACMGVPSKNKELGRTSDIIECLAAYSHKELKPAYYKNLLTIRSVRDNDSSEMLDIIFATGEFETDLVLFNNDGISGTLRATMCTSGSDYTSKLSVITSGVKTKLGYLIKELNLCAQMTPEK